MTLFFSALWVSILLGACGQLLLKTGALSGSLRAQLLAPHTLGGMGVYAVSALLYLVALRKIPLSTAFPSVSLSYVAVAVAAHYLYREPLGLTKFAGIALIGIGVFLVAR
jgi:drug/metabolite transporter (DMT)-like permease